jgi:CCR4-NOT transcription complex subunit 1
MTQKKTFQDVAPPVIDRAVKIAMTTCEQLVKKDFALDHDENRLRQAAHHMVRNLTAGMAMITCRDHLHQVGQSTAKSVSGS